LGSEFKILVRRLTHWLALYSALLAFLAVTPAVLALPDEAVGHVVSVISADSLGIEMLIPDARTSSIDSIKLADIQAPSTVTAEGKAARTYAVSLLKNKTVYLDIEDDPHRARNIWSQLFCVVYLMDQDYQPVWPPVNRMLVDAGCAVISDDPNNEFNSSDWWQDAPPFSAEEIRDRFLSKLQVPSSSEQKVTESTSFAATSPAVTSPAVASPVAASPAVTSPAAGTMVNATVEDSRKVSILETDRKTGTISIGYRK
jgi:endonuclease YncB( thermonuclease family)